MTLSNTCMAIEKELLNTVLETSDRKQYLSPKITVKEFEILVKKVIACENGNVSNWKEIGNNIIELKTQTKHTFAFSPIINVFTITYIKNTNGYNAFLQTQDRGPERMLDDQRFVPSSEIIELLRFHRDQCSTP